METVTPEPKTGGFMDIVRESTKDAPDYSAPIVEPTEVIKTPEPTPVETPKPVEPPKTEIKKSDIPIEDIIKKIAPTEPEAPAKTDEVIPEPEEPKGLRTEAQKSAFANLTKQLKEERAAKIALETKMKEIEANKPPVTTDEVNLYKQQLEELKKANQEYENQLAINKVEASSVFKENIAKPLKDSESKIREIAGQYSVNVQELLQASEELTGSERRSKIKSIISELDATDALEIKQELDKYSTILSQKKEVISRASEAKQLLEKQEQEAAKQKEQQYAELSKKAYGEVWDEFSKNTPVLSKVEGNDEWNAKIEQIRVEAEKLDATPLDPRNRAILTYQGVGFPMLLEVFKGYAQKTQSEMAALTKQVEMYKKGTPTINDVPAPKSNSTSDKPRDGESMSDFIKRTLSNN
jgi:DNA repair exonuclease SbcCD ATPase subunit